MSRIATKSSTRGIPTRKPAKTPSRTGAIPKKAKAAQEEQPKGDGLPAFSLGKSKMREAINWKELKKKTMHRNSPPGEDMKEIRNVLRAAKESEEQLTVEEFVNLISPYTADNGTELRNVTAEDLANFRKFSRKVYETLTQDVSDVLINEQLQLMTYYDEKNSQLSQRMMQCINEIYEIVPNFDFERYMREKDEYLNFILPLPVEIQRDDEEIAQQRRQEAYHRLQWLRTEGERLNEENNRLKQKLDLLKRQQNDQQEMAQQIAQEAEERRLALEAKEAEAKEALEQLNESIEKSVLQNEVETCKKDTRAAIAAGKSSKVKKKTSAALIKKKRTDWVSDVAADIDQEAVQEAVTVEASKVPPKASVQRQRRRPPSPKFSPIKTPPPPAAKPRSPFHYSPPAAEETQQQGAVSRTGRVPSKTGMQRPTRKPSPHFSPIKSPPPPPARKPPSPFHYSPPPQQEAFQYAPPQTPQGAFGGPPQTPQGAFGGPPQTPQGAFGGPPQTPQGAFGGPPQREAFGGRQQRTQETVIEEKTTTVTEKRLPPPRRSMAPRDSWGGFY